MKRYDFVIVGGGPVGCRVAARLARDGYQVVVLEKNLSVGRPVCCTGIVSSECLDRFKIPSELILKELSSASVYSPSGKVLRLARDEMQAVVIERGGFNAWMARQAQDAGVDYLLGHTVKNIAVNADEVVVYSECSGKQEIFYARAVVLACGFGSKLPRKLGLGRSDRWTVGAQAEAEAPGLSEIEIYIGNDIAPDYFAWLVPCGDSRALAGLMARENADGYLSAFLERLKSGGKIVTTGKPAYRGITTGQPRRICSDRLILVGDAAGQVKPLTGGGIYYGLLCADIAADVLHTAFEAGDFSVSRLSGYQKGCRELLGSELKLAGRAHSLYARMSDRRIDWLFDQAANRGLAGSLSARSDIGFDWHGRAMLQLVKQAIFHR
jgi:digeranylgeranylglycerophospholipid reductase